jgi:hypothetical protein
MKKVGIGIFLLYLYLGAGCVAPMISVTGIVFVALVLWATWKVFFWLTKKVIRFLVVFTVKNRINRQILLSLPKYVTEIKEENYLAYDFFLECNPQSEEHWKKAKELKIALENTLIKGCTFLRIPKWKLKVMLV